MDADNHIFEQDVVVSAELFARRSGLPDPERSLMLAVLEDAMRCFLDYGDAEGKQRALYDEARGWLESDARMGLYDFANVCDVLGIEVAWLRRRLFALRRRRAHVRGPDAWQSAG